MWSPCSLVSKALANRHGLVDKSICISFLELKFLGGEEISSLTVLEAHVQNQGVGEVPLPLNSLGEDLSLLLLVSVASGVSWLVAAPLALCSHDLLPCVSPCISVTWVSCKVSSCWI